MAILLTKAPAIGGPGIVPRWTRSDKHGVGTAYSAWSQVWFTVSKGILNEVYYPTIFQVGIDAGGRKASPTRGKKRSHTGAGVVRAATAQ